jgi:hypothetical protein
MFAFNTADVNDFIKEAKQIDQPVKILQPGEKFSSINKPFSIVK